MPNNILTHQDLHWFHLCNSATFAEKRAFYAFKTRFLHRYGTPDGWDDQEIAKPCWNCDGTGDYLPNVECRSCGGSGVYRNHFVWLARYLLGGTVYHIPDERPPYLVPVKEHFEGYIKHESQCSESAAYRCFLRLLLRHEPMNFYWHVIDRIKRGVSRHKAILTWRLLKLRNKLDLFKSVPESPDDVPF